MDKISALDTVYENIITHLVAMVPDGIIDVNLDLLRELGLLQEPMEATSLTRYFHVIETPEKITLFNESYVVWVVPTLLDGESVTLVLIALNNVSLERPEMAFIVSGVYNTSKMVLRVLEKFLHNIQETEDVLTKLQKTADK